MSEPAVFRSMAEVPWYIVKQMSRPSQRPANGHPIAHHVSGCGGASPGCLVPLTSPSSSTTPVYSEPQTLLPAVPASPKHCKAFSDTCVLLPVPAASYLMQLPGKAILPFCCDQAPVVPCISLASVSFICTTSHGHQLLSLLRPFPAASPAPHTTQVLGKEVVMIVELVHFAQVHTLGCSGLTLLDTDFL